MVRTEAQKQAQKRYRERNREKCNAINLASRHRRYNEVGRPYGQTYYQINKNYYGVDNMGKSLIRLFGDI